MGRPNTRVTLALVAACCCLTAGCASTDHQQVASQDAPVVQADSMQARSEYGPKMEFTPENGWQRINPKNDAYVPSREQIDNSDVQRISVALADAGHTDTPAPGFMSDRYAGALQNLGDMLAKPRWRTCFFQLPEPMLELIFQDLGDQATAESLFSSITEAYTLLVTDRSQQKAASLTLFVLNDTTPLHDYLLAAHQMKRQDPDEMNPLFTVRDLSSEEFTGIDADAAVMTTYVLEQSGTQQWNHRYLHVVRDNVVLELNDQGLNLTDEQIVAAMEEVFQRIEAVMPEYRAGHD